PRNTESLLARSQARLSCFQRIRIRCISQVYFCPDLARDGVANFKVKSLLVSGLGIPFSSARVKVQAARCVAPKIHSGGQRNLGLDLEGRLPAFPSGSSVCFKSERM